MRFILIILLFNLSSCWVVRAYRIRHMNLTDHRKLPSVNISKSADPFYFKITEVSSRSKKTESLLDSVLAGTETAAFLVIRNDSIIHEKYFMGFNENSLLPSNSMAKSFTGTLVGIALDEGKIRSVLEPITNYVNELKQRDIRFEKVTIQHLLDMRSGFDFDDATYTLKSDAVKIGLMRNLGKQLLKIKIKRDPGEFEYQSINTQLLGLIIERATGQKLQDYMEQKLWKPMGAEHDGNFNLDSRKWKHVYGSAGLNATARDFAKLGRLYLNKGKRGDLQVISQKWVATVSSVDTLDKYDGYKNQWWNKRVNENIEIKERHSYQLSYRTNAFNAFGFLEQIIYVNPEKKLIIVRLGKHWPQQYGFTQLIYTLGSEL